MIKDRIPGFGRLFGAALSCGLLAATAVPAAAQDKLSFAWPGNMSSSIAPFILASELGYFKDENINLDVVVLSGSGVINPQLMAGALFTAYTTYEPLIISRKPGNPNFDFRFGYNAVRRSIWEMSVLEESPIKSIKDLAGKTIGVGALTFGNVLMTKAILKREGIDPGSVQFVAVGVGATAFQALKSGKVDALNIYDISNVLLQQQGTKIRFIPFPPEFSRISSHGLPFTNKNIKENPKQVIGFGRATAKGTIACIANPEGCLAAYWKAYPAQKPPGTNADALRRELPLLNTRIEHMEFWREGEPKKYGAYDDKDWSPSITSLREGGLIDDTPIGLDTLYTNQFVDEYNKFDEATVVKAAKAYKP